ncbi:Hypothetical predicted protein [Olea europaea subsp. europaea]|uniref:Uncharacterized protein n=1 Tax=Olea europaea subsp. europaea TaxID=158383 RepID=A0A8S0Q615_OLEEU|nr:Hypothetical predicted protein [Olea europaea subsp. europaea]
MQSNKRKSINLCLQNNASHDNFRIFTWVNSILITALEEAKAKAEEEAKMKAEEEAKAKAEEEAKAKAEEEEKLKAEKEREENGKEGVNGEVKENGEEAKHSSANGVSH